MKTRELAASIIMEAQQAHKRETGCSPKKTLSLVVILLYQNVLLLSSSSPNIRAHASGACWLAVGAAHARFINSVRRLVAIVPVVVQPARQTGSVRPPLPDY